MTSLPPDVNESLLNKALDAIEAEPWRWNQNNWASNDPHSVVIPPVEAPAETCGTTMCLAGHVLLQTGVYEIEVIPDRYNPSNRALDNVFFVNKGAKPIVDGYDEPRYMRVDPWSKARNLLNIDDGLAHALFVDTSDFTDEGGSPAEFRAYVYKTITDHYYPDPNVPTDGGEFW